MKKASKVLYIVGNVFNVLNIICSALLIAVGTLMINRPETFAEKFAENNIVELATAANVTAVGIALVAVTIFAIAISIIVLIIANKAIKNIETDNKSKAVHIAMIVISVLYGDIFYLIASIFGVCVKASETAQKTE